MTTDDIMALSEGCATPTPLRAVVAELVAERDALKAENLRLAGEIASRNQRALDGDQCKASWDELYDRAEAFRVERDALLEWKAAANGAGIQQEQELMRVETERDALRAALAAQPQQATSCTDPHCPCRDGDACHYKDAADGTKAWAAQPVAQEPRVCWLVEEFSDTGNSTGRYMQDQSGLTITTDAQQARRFRRSRTATFRATDMREKWGTAWRPVSHVFLAAQPQQDADWMTPTTYLQRMSDAVTLLCCGKRPIDEMVAAWIAGSSEDLQSWCIERGPAWAQGIVVLDAAALLAETPTDGVEHEAAQPRQAPVQAAQPVPPIDMVLHCPKCGLRHVDEAEGEGDDEATTQRLDVWRNPPHRSHLCHGCGHIWRPADVPTNGVAAIKTRGANDSEAAQPQQAEPAAWQERQEVRPGVFGEWYECRHGWSHTRPREVVSAGIRYQFRPLYA